MSTEARREIGELLADSLPDAEELARLQSVDFLHQGCAMLRRKDNEALIEQRDQARGMVVELEGENAHLEAERDALIRDVEQLRQQIGPPDQGNAEGAFAEQLDDIIVRAKS